jgi:hypothetical protein
VNTKQAGAVVGVFPTGPAAQLAIDDLYYAKFSEQEVGMVTRDGSLVKADTSTTTQEKSANTGSATGIAAGGAVGVVVGTIIVNLVPGLGQIITGGALAAIAIAGLIGAAGGSLAGAFVGMGLTEDEAKEADREFNAGRSIVVVRAPGREAEAIDIMAKRGAQQLRRTNSPPIVPSGA